MPNDKRQPLKTQPMKLQSDLELEFTRGAVPSNAQSATLWRGLAQIVMSAIVAPLAQGQEHADTCPQLRCSHIHGSKADCEKVLEKSKGCVPHLSFMMRLPHSQY